MLRRILSACLLLVSSLVYAQAPSTVVCFGDSLTAGYGAHTGLDYPAFLQRDLSRDGHPAEVLNQGVVGDTAKDAVHRLPDVLKARPMLVVVELGANDALHQEPLPEIEQSLATVIETLQQHGIPLVLAGLEIPPHPGFTPPPQFTTPYMRQFYAIYRSLAARYHVALVPFFLEGVYGDPSMMSQDGIHPNGNGYRKVAETVLPQVEEQLALRKP